MSSEFAQSFREQAVEKALNRPSEVSIRDIATSLGVGYSTLSKWLRDAKSSHFESAGPVEMPMNTEKRPQDWSLEERLSMVIACAALEGEALSRLCRERGVYPHHVEQWRQDFIGGGAEKMPSKAASNARALAAENKALKSELRRKEKALAEAAALLILQKKVADHWGCDEDSL